MSVVVVIAVVVGTKIASSRDLRGVCALRALSSYKNLIYSQEFPHLRTIVDFVRNGLTCLHCIYYVKFPSHVVVYICGILEEVWLHEFIIIMS